jgi:hypothetical protein
MQFTEDENSRTYLDFDTINDALDGILEFKLGIELIPLIL